MKITRNHNLWILEFKSKEFNLEGNIRMSILFKGLEKICRGELLNKLEQQTRRNNFKISLWQVNFEIFGFCKGDADCLRVRLGAINLDDDFCRVNADIFGERYGRIGKIKLMYSLTIQENQSGHKVSF